MHRYIDYSFSWRVIFKNRLCYYYDLNDSSKRGEDNSLLKSIDKKKVHEN